MVKKMTNDEIEELVGLKETNKNFLKARQNGLLLTDNQVNTLEKYNIDPSKCGSMTELLYMIDCATEGFTEDECADLQYLADNLAERNYYENTRK